MMVVLTASQNLKLLDSVDVEDRRRHGKIRSTMISDTGSYQGQNGVEKETQNKHRSRATHFKSNCHVKRMMILSSMSAPSLQDDAGRCKSGTGFVSNISSLEQSHWSTPFRNIRIVAFVADKRLSNQSRRHDA